MVLAGLLVSLVALAGWLVLNWLALQSHGLTLEQKLAMGVGWLVIFAVLTFALTRLGF